MKKMSSADTAVMLLVVVGALNWGLWGLLGLNLVATLFGTGSLLERLVYVLVGAAGVYMLWGWYNMSSKKK